MNTLILEDGEHGEFAVDVYRKLSNDRILFICEPLSDEVATDIAATLILKDLEAPDEKITLFINCDGGEIRNALMVYDVMQMIDAPVETVCIGNAVDGAALILTAGTPGMRLATKNSNIIVSQLVHEYTTMSNLTDAQKILDLYLQDNKRMIEIFSKSTKKTIKQVTEAFDQRLFLTSGQSVKFGIIDRVIKFNK